MKILLVELFKIMFHNNIYYIGFYMTDKSKVDFHA